MVGRSGGGAIWVMLAAELLAAGSVRAADKAPQPASAAALQPVYACRAEPDPTRRLACYDAAVSELASAESTGDVQVLDQQTIRETKRRLFGFDRLHLPVLGAGGGADRKHAPAAAEIDRVEGVIASADRDPDGRWIVVLEDGARWHQTDDTTLGRWPRKGNPVVIERGVLGSFRMRVANQPGIKVQREG